MKYTVLFLLPCLFLLTACFQNSIDLEQYMVDTSEFNIDSTLLKDGDYVDILGASGKLNKLQNLDFYNLVVVRSVKTGDTINVLSSNFFFNSQSRRTQFVSAFTTNGKIIDLVLNNRENIEDFNVNEVKVQLYDKVFYDYDYIQLDVRKYPAVVGTFGDFKSE